MMSMMGRILVVSFYCQQCVDFFFFSAFLVHSKHNVARGERRSGREKIFNSKRMGALIKLRSFDKSDARHMAEAMNFFPVFYSLSGFSSLLSELAQGREKVGGKVASYSTL